MIEKIMHQIITDLGATGVLIVGIFCIQYYATKKICKDLKALNHKTTEINQTLQTLGALLERKFNSEKNPD